MPDSTQHRCHPPPPSEVRAIMAEIFQAGDPHDMEMFRKLNAIGRLINYLKTGHRKDSQLSAARMRLLIWLAVHDRLGHTNGLQPSELSEFLGVSRNTVSSLLNGLEEQGLVERHLNPTDRRQFLIRITPDGDQTVRTHAPEFASFVTGLFSVLSADERQTLLALLDKLFNSLLERAEAIGLHVPGSEPESDPEQA